MKRLLPLLLSLLLLISCAESVEEESSIPEESSEETESSTPEFTTPIPTPVSIITRQLGIPLAERYECDNIARTPNDIILHDGFLHIGSGDYTENLGPIDLYRYETKSRRWELSTSVPEEAILRFCEIDGVLYAPGIDGKGVTEFGSYYQFNGNSWVQNSVIPFGIHVFDIAKYDDMLFFAIGRDSDANAVGYKNKGGQFILPDFIGADGNKLVSSDNDFDTMRVYDIFVLNEALYALRNGNEIYHFDGTRFVFHAKWEDFKTVHIGYDGGTVKKLIFKDKLFIAGGWLYSTSGARTLSKIENPNNDYAADLAVNGDTLFLLTDRKLSSGEFEIRVLASFDGESFYDYCSFTYPIPAVSFDVGDNALYFGMMDNTNSHDKNGMIIEAKITN